MGEEKLSGAARRIYKGLAYYLHQKSCIGKKKHTEKERAKQEYLQKHGTLKGWNPSKANGIYSIKTMRTYESQIRSFAKYCAAKHKIRQMSGITIAIAQEYLRDLEAEGKAPWTISTAASAINKALGWNLSPKQLGLKSRKKTTIKKCRTGEPYTKKEYEKYKDQITLARAIGARRASIFNKTDPQKLITPRRCVRNAEGIVIGVLLIEKGGKKRVAPVLNEYKGAVTEIVNRIARERGEDTPMFDGYGGHIKNHRLRAEYAAKLLHQLEEERKAGKPLFGGDFPLGKYCKLKGKDIKRGEKTQGHDTDLLGAVSGALGHNRVEVVLRHYMYLY